MIVTGEAGYTNYAHFGQNVRVGIVFLYSFGFEYVLFWEGGANE